MSISRREFLHLSGAAAGGFAGLLAFAQRHGYALTSEAGASAGYGPLVADPKHLLDLPEGFSYQIVSRAGDPMDDGLFAPGKPDGMAAFPGPEGKTIVVRNHELNPDDLEFGAFGPDGRHTELLERTSFYDFRVGDKYPCMGGTSTFLYDTKAGKLERQQLSLVGTLRNCAGGPTPWNTWITCEESVVKSGESDCEHDHGYNFEVPATMDGPLAAPVALKAMGRFNHEAVAVHEPSGIVYETEDRWDGLIYRFIPEQPGDLSRGGKLQALAVMDQPSLDTRNWESVGARVGQPLAVRWIDIDNVESPEDDLRYQGFDEKGAARFARGEGMWAAVKTDTNGAPQHEIYFACTNGGAKKKGQIWRYVASPAEGKPEEKDSPGRLDLFVEPNDGSIIENADNLTVSPWGDLFVCEDGSEDQFLVGVTPDGEIYKFGRNALSGSELAGCTFSPDGTTLFVNIQRDGYTLAIRGPWKGTA